jgi:hypothetical protein
MKKLNLYNPLREDFSVTYDLKGDGNPELFTIPSKEIKTFEEPIASHVRKHLADAVLDKKYKTGYAVDLQLIEIKKEITIKLDE